MQIEKVEYTPETHAGSDSGLLVLTQTKVHEMR